MSTDHEFFPFLTLVWGPLPDPKKKSHFTQLDDIMKIAFLFFPMSKEPLREQVVKGEVDSLESDLRYLGYAGRLRTALAATTRYLAYTSDVGEAFRPIVHPAIVTAAYGISWAYLGLDVGYEGYKAYHAGQVKKKENDSNSFFYKHGIRTNLLLQQHVSSEVCFNPWRVWPFPC